MKRLVAGVLLAGCGSPTLVVQHFDPSTGSAQIQVDGVPVGKVAPGDAFETSIETGVHKLTVSGETGDREIEVIIDQDDLVLTLRPERTR